MSETSLPASSASVAELIFDEISKSYARDDEAWADSPFLWIRGLSSLRKGSIGEQFMHRLVESWGIEVQPRRSRGHDRIIGPLRVETKLSLLWAVTAEFSFAQIRDHDYDVACLIGLMPRDVRVWFVPKDVLIARAKGQHGGAAATETSWLRFVAESAPEWLAEYGGSLEAAERVLRMLLAASPEA